MNPISISTLLEIAGFAAGLISVYFTLASRVTKLEVRQDNHEAQSQEIKEGMQEIQKTVNKILITLEGKANRS